MISSINKPMKSTTTASTAAAAAITPKILNKLITSTQSTTTVGSNKSLRYERNYSYIEAMKDDIDIVVDETKSNDTITSYDSNNNYISKTIINKKSLTLDSKSNLNSFSTTSTSSSILSNKMQNLDQQQQSQQQQQQKLSKSQSQSSILNLFKSHFSSPFLIKKFRSKSRDKLNNSVVSQPATTSSASSTQTKTTVTLSTSVTVKRQQKAPPSASSASQASKLTLSKIKSTSKKQQQQQQVFQQPQQQQQQQQMQPQVPTKQPLLIINRNLDETANNSIPSANTAIDQQQQHHQPLIKQQNSDKKENIIPTTIKKPQQQPLPQQPSLTIKLSSDQLNDDQKLTNKSQQIQSLKSSSLSPISLQQEISTANKPVVQNGSTRQLSYLQLSCLNYGYDTYPLQPGLSIQTSPSLLSASSSLISTNKLISPTRYKLNDSKKTSLHSSPVSTKQSDLTDAVAKTTTTTIEPAKIETTKPNESLVLPLAELNKTELLNQSESSNIPLTSTPTEETIKEKNQIDIITPANIELIIENQQKPVNVIDNQLDTTIGATSQIKDGKYFLEVLDKETKRLTNFCSIYNVYLNDNSLNLDEEIKCKIQSSIGQSNLLIASKFEQFKGLCNQNVRQKQGIIEKDEQIVLDKDLAGFWDLSDIEVDSLVNMFNELDEIKNNNWQLVTKVAPKPTKKVIKPKINTVTPVYKTKTTSAAAATTTTTTTSTTKTESKADASRKRLLEAKRNAALMKQQQQQQQQQESNQTSDLIDIVIFNSEKKQIQ